MDVLVVCHGPLQPHPPYLGTGTAYFHHGCIQNIYICLTKSSQKHLNPWWPPCTPQQVLGKKKPTRKPDTFKHPKLTPSHRVIRRGMPISHNPRHRCVDNKIVERSGGWSERGGKAPRHGRQTGTWWIMMAGSDPDMMKWIFFNSLSITPPKTNMEPKNDGFL